MSDRVRVLDCEIDSLDFAQTLEQCREIIESRVPTEHVGINAAKLVALRKNERLREIIAQCGLVSADGQAIVWASRLLGHPLPERVNGTDLMYALLELADREAYRVYFFGARQEVLETAVARIHDRYPKLAVAGYRNGYFDDAESHAICDEIRNAAPDILFVAISSPRKEYWLGAHYQRLAIPLVMGVGGSIDVVAGVVKRAPVWMQRAGLEWFFRFLQEPRRMWRRYLTTNTAFMLLVAREMVATRRTPALKRNVR
jgi:N-acetylglucosaminyldiphosphoundecaprenol N-acetyl-beta-D-mannosaminyltransferase